MPTPTSARREGGEVEREAAGAIACLIRAQNCLVNADGEATIASIIRNAMQPEREAAKKLLDFATVALNWVVNSPHDEACECVTISLNRLCTCGHDSLVEEMTAFVCEQRGIAYRTATAPNAGKGE